MAYIVIALITMICMFAYIAIAIFISPIVFCITAAITIPFLVLRLLAWDKERKINKKVVKEGYVFK